MTTTVDTTNVQWGHRRGSGGVRGGSSRADLSIRPNSGALNKSKAAYTYFRFGDAIMELTGWVVGDTIAPGVSEDGTQLFIRRDKDGHTLTAANGKQGNNKQMRGQCVAAKLSPVGTFAPRNMSFDVTDVQFNAGILIIPLN